MMDKVIAKQVSEYYEPKFPFPCQVTRCHYFQISIHFNWFCFSIDILLKHLVIFHAYDCIYMLNLLSCIQQVYHMVGLLGFIINPWSKPTWFKIVYKHGTQLAFQLFIKYVPKSKLQIISPKYHLSSGILILKSMCTNGTSIQHLCAHIQGE